MPLLADDWSVAKDAPVGAGLLFASRERVLVFFRSSRPLLSENRCSDHVLRGHWAVRNSDYQLCLRASSALPFPEFNVHSLRVSWNPCYSFFFFLFLRCGNGVIIPQKCRMGQ